MPKRLNCKKQQTNLFKLQKRIHNKRQHSNTINISKTIQNKSHSNLYKTLKINLLTKKKDLWSSGYDVALTRRRSPVQIRSGPFKIT